MPEVISSSKDFGVPDSGRRGGRALAYPDPLRRPCASWELVGDPSGRPGLEAGPQGSSIPTYPLTLVCASLLVCISIMFYLLASNLL